MKYFATLLLAGALALGGLAPAQAQSAPVIELTDAQMVDLVRRSYQYVAMFNVNNKFALDENASIVTNGYNRVVTNSVLADHRFRSIARPNNDTLYTAAMVDVTETPMVLTMPAFDSSYVSLMVTAYDHYVNIPLSTTMGDFSEPTTMLFYSARTPGYNGEPIDGVDHIFELTGDFASAVFRVMPHAAEPERLVRNISAKENVDLLSLSEFLGDATSAPEFLPWGSPSIVGRNLTLKEDIARFPTFGSDIEIFEDRFVEVMQFVVNHTTFDTDDALDQGLLAALAPLGIVPGKAFDPATAAQVDGAALGTKVRQVQLEVFAKMHDAEYLAEALLNLFLPKGEMDLDIMVSQTVSGPIGVPATEAVYPQVPTEDGSHMNAMFDYEIVMAPENMPPANAFWSATLYDLDNGFFIPNEQFKYSVGENAGFQLDQDGGIRIVIAAEKPDGVPEENWLPINRVDEDMNVQFRLYDPDLDRYTTWPVPVARRLN